MPNQVTLIVRLPDGPPLTQALQAMLTVFMTSMLEQAYLDPEGVPDIGTFESQMVGGSVYWHVAKGVCDARAP